MGEERDPACTCGVIYLGLQATDALNLNPECPAHGLTSEWYNSPEQGLSLRDR